MSYERRKLPRFHITPCQFLDFQLRKTFSVQDISQGGLALRLLDREDLSSFAVGSDHEGILKVEGRKVSARFQVKNIRGSVIGGAWLQLHEEFSALLEELSHPERLATGLRKYEHPDLGATIWFHNPVGVDLLFYDQRAVKRWMLFLHQRFIQWEKDGGISTGRSMAEDEEGYAHGIIRLETRLIDYDTQVDRNLVEFTKDFLQHARIEAEELKKLMYSHLNGVI